MNQDTFANYLTTHYSPSEHCSISRSDLRAHWTQTNNGASTGILKLYKYLETITVGSLTKTHLRGWILRSNIPTASTATAPAASPATAPAASPVASPATAPAASPVASPVDNYKLEKLRLMALKLEQDAKKHDEDARLAQLKIDEDTRLAQLKLEQDAKKIDEDARLAQLKIDAKKAMHSQSLDTKILLTRERIEAKERIARQNREHCTIENNKNRRMYYLTRHPYLDVEYYGNHASQYQTAHSSMVNAFTKIKIHEGIPDDRNDMLIDIISDVVSKHQEVLPITTDSGSSSDECLIEVKQYPYIVTEILDECKKQPDVQMSKKREWVKEIKDQTDVVAAVATRPHNDIMIPTYLELLKLINQDRSDAKELPKSKYIKFLNKPILDQDSGEMYINCYTCGAQDSLKSSGVHRSHNLPKSNGGSYHVRNMFLCCSSCNHKMGNGLTVEEYSCNMLGDQLASTSLIFKSRIDVNMSLDYISDTDTCDSDDDTISTRDEEDAPLIEV